MATDPVDLADSFGDSVDKWHGWLTDILVGKKPALPPLAVGREELLHAVIRLHESLPTDLPRGALQTAVAELFEGTPAIQPMAPRLYFLIELICALKPIQAKQMVRRYLFDNALSAISYGAVNLHTRLLAAAGRYHVDEQLAAYIHDTADKSCDFKYLTTCVDVISPRGPTDTFPLLGEVIPAIRTAQEAIQLAQTLEDALPHLGYRALHQWFIHHAGQFTASWPEQMYLFSQALRVDFLSWNENKVPADDPSRSLLCAYLHAAVDDLRPPQLTLLVAATCRTDREALLATLRYVYGACKARQPQLRPWRVNYRGDSFRRVYRRPDRFVVYHDSQEVELDPAVAAEEVDVFEQLESEVAC